MAGKVYLCDYGHQHRSKAAQAECIRLRRLRAEHGRGARVRQPARHQVIRGWHLDFGDGYWGVTDPKGRYHQGFVRLESAQNYVRSRLR